jgi:glycosyltransferase involved in cell wall biosynthesis
VKSVLVLQGEIVEYRRPLLNALADHFRVSVLHSGRPFKLPTDQYDEQVIPKRQIGPFHLQNPAVVLRAVKAHDATIAMFDLAWPAYIMPVFAGGQSRYIFHGHRYSGDPLADYARDFLMKWSDRQLLYGEEEVAKMIARGVDPAKIVIAPNTIHVENHQDFSSADKNSLLFVGRLQERKRLDLALDAFAAIQTKIDPSIVFDIVGVGSPEAALRAQVQALGLSEKVRFHGHVTDNEVLAGLFKTAFAYVSPGPVGLGVLHSFAFGVPVLTLRDGYHGPEFQNLVQEKNALIAPDDTTFTSDLLRVCTDQGLARNLGRNAYARYAGERTIAHMIAGFRKAIDE